MISTGSTELAFWEGNQLAKKVVATAKTTAIE
jgi:hypothetical protein